MDYRDDSLFEEEIGLEEHRMTPAKRAKLFFKVFFYFLVILTYGLLMMRFFVSCDVPLLNKITFSENTKQIYNKSPNDFRVFNVYTPVTFNLNRTLLIKSVAYTPNGEELEFGVRFKKTIAGGSTAPTLEYKLVDSDGNEYEVVSRISEERYDYGYERISFGGVKLNLERNITKRVADGESVDNRKHSNYDESDYEAKVENNDDPENVKYKLYVYYKETRLRAFLIYDDDVPISKEKYKP